MLLECFLFRNVFEKCFTVCIRYDAYPVSCFVILQLY